MNSPSATTKDKDFNEVRIRYQLENGKLKISLKMNLTSNLKSTQLILQFQLILISPTNQMITSEMNLPVQIQTRTSSKL